MSLTGVSWSFNHIGTSTVVETKTQQFQGDHGAYKELEMLYKYGSTTDYQFFSEDVASMIKYSSSWFEGETEKMNVNETKPTVKAIEWFSDEVNYYDIGYAEKVSLFKENKTWVNDKLRDDISETTKKMSNVPNKLVSNVLELKAEALHDDVIEIKSFLEKSNLKNEIEETTLSNITVKEELGIEVSRKKAKKLPKVIRSSRRLRSDTVCSKESWLIKKSYSELNKKLATSRFGRTRRVIDFSSFDLSNA